ncbi:hypothetical protein G6L37_04735 [Agrobacterium rubi]|nr:hypothetical protein [Agrobacterium rubi]NTF24660.1 hypothetical protein [Agrobacterium rubi]
MTTQPDQTVQTPRQGPALKSWKLAFSVAFAVAFAIVAMAIWGAEPLSEKLDRAVESAFVSEKYAGCSQIDRSPSCEVGDFSLIDVGNPQSRVLLVFQKDVFVASVVAGALHIDAKLNDADRYRVKARFAEAFDPKA